MSRVLKLTSAFLILVMSNAALGHTCKKFYSEGDAPSARFFRNLSARMDRQADPHVRPSVPIKEVFNSTPWIPRSDIVHRLDPNTNQSQVTIGDAKLRIMQNEIDKYVSRPELIAEYPSGEKQVVMSLSTLLRGTSSYRHHLVKNGDDVYLFNMDRVVNTQGDRVPGFSIYKLKAPSVSSEKWKISFVSTLEHGIGVRDTGLFEFAPLGGGYFLVVAATGNKTPYYNLLRIRNGKAQTATLFHTLSMLEGFSARLTSDGMLLINEIKYTLPIRNGEFNWNNRYGPVLSRSRNSLFERSFSLDLNKLSFK